MYEIRTIRFKTAFFFLRNQLITYTMFSLQVFLQTRRGHQIILHIVVSYHVIAKN